MLYQEMMNRLSDNDFPETVLICSNQATGVYRPDYSPHYAIPGRYDVLGVDPHGFGILLRSESGSLFACNNFEDILGLQEINEKSYGNLPTND